MPTSDSEAVHLQALELENQHLRRSVEELSLLNDLAREIGASLDADEVVGKIIRRALKSVQAEQGVITLVEESADDPMKTLVRTAGSSVIHGPYRINDSLLGWMQHNKKPLLLNDPVHDKRFQGANWDVTIRSILCVPLMNRSQLIGMLTVYNKKTEAGFTEDDQRLLAIIAAQSAQIVENARLYEEEKALLHMREEVRLAYDIQTSLLPKASPGVPGYDIAGVSLAADTVGGDYFDYITLHDGCLGLCVGDVSGKGLPASLLMANVQATLRGQAPWTDSVKICLERANQLLCESIRTGTFVTLFYGILDPHNHQFRYANAGHNRPLFHTSGSVTRLDLGGLALGLLSTATYQDDTLTFAAGDVLLIYSDGVTEAMNPGREQFEEDRLTELIREYAADPAQTLVDRIVEAVQHHAAEAPASDDMTLLAIRRIA